MFITNIKQISLFNFLLILYAQIIYSKSEEIKTSNIPSSEFVIRLEFANSPLQQPLTNNKLNLKLETICKLAMERSLSKHLFGKSSIDEKMDAIEALNDWRSSTGNNKIIKNRENEEKKENEQNSEDKAVKNFTSGGNTKLEMAAESSFWIDLNSMRQFNVRLLGIDRPKPWRHTFILSFAVFLQEKAISAEVMVRDLSLVSLAEMSAHLQLTVLRIDALVHKEMAKQTQWWLIGIILGAGILIIACCWALLFFWLNICVRRESQLDKGVNEETEIENRRSEEDVERCQIESTSTPQPILPSQLKEAENISSTTSSVNEKQDIANNELLLEKTNLKTKQNLLLQDIKNNKNKKRRLPKLKLKKKYLPKSSQKRRIIIREENVDGKINKKQEKQHYKINEKEKEEEAKQKSIEASLQQLSPPIELEAAIQAINEKRNNCYQLPTNWNNFKFIKEQKIQNNNRLQPYWVADKLENIFGIYNKNKENPKPALPSDSGDVRIGAII